jgi:hypothetical protein
MLVKKLLANGIVNALRCSIYHHLFIKIKMKAKNLCISSIYINRAFAVILAYPLS